MVIVVGVRDPSDDARCIIAVDDASQVVGDDAQRMLLDGASEMIQDDRFDYKVNFASFVDLSMP